MSFFHRPKTRRLTVPALLLISLFLQVQAVFACDLMEDPVQSSCCCELQMDKGCASGGGCGGDNTASQGDCCQVIASAPTAESATSTLVSKAVLNKSDIQHPKSTSTLLTLPEPFHLARPSVPAVGSYRVPWLTGKDTYLVTLRFRV